MHRSLTCIGTVLLLIAVGCESDACEVSLSWTVSLSTPTDLLLITVAGSSCEKAVLSVRIATPSGEEIFQRSKRILLFYSRTGEPPYAEPPSLESAQRIARQLARPRKAQAVSDLGTHFAGEQDDGIATTRFLVSEATLSRLRDQPLFTLSWGWEQWIELAFDPEQGRVIAVAEGWL